MATNPNIAKTLNEARTPAQLYTIYKVAGDKGLSATRLCRELFNCEPEDLTRRAAGRLIDAMKEARWAF